MKQYESMPYPGLSDKEISDEAQYYKKEGVISTPFNYYKSIALENTNHYLHQGGETFKQVLYNRFC